MALSSSHCLPHIKTRLWGLDYPTVYVVCLILPQLFKIYLILSYRHLNSLTSGTFIPTPHNKFIHGPYLAFFFNHLQLFVFWKLTPQYFTFSEPLPVSSVRLIPYTAFYIINVSNSWRVIFTQSIICFLDSFLSSPSSLTVSLLTFLLLLFFVALLWLWLCQNLTLGCPALSVQCSGQSQ